MNPIFAILIVLITLVIMEGVSWTIHKYLFHGPLWFIHKSHHETGHKGWEFNDVFSIGFAAISIVLMYFGKENYDYRFWIGTGITTYGFTYFILHDIFVHNRLKPFQTRNLYLLRLRRAHKMHHKSLEKLPSESYGLLWFSKKYKV